MSVFNLQAMDTENIAYFVPQLKPLEEYTELKRDRLKDWILS